MKNLIVPFLAVISLLMTACENDEPLDKVQVIRMSVSNETGIAYGFMGEPYECMLVMTEDNPGVWKSLDFEAIDGFTYEKGHEYYLEVKRTILANPPQDASNRKYSLVRILEDRYTIAPEKPADKEVNSEEDIEYYDMCPIEKYAISSEYMVDDKCRIYTDDKQTMGMSYEMCRIHFENILDKADPNFNKFNSVSYMAIYSYVISPLSKDIRLVRNNSHGPMFDEVIPEEEFKYICETLKPEEELKYALVLVNIHKQGLQKLEFIVKKR